MFARMILVAFFLSKQGTFEFLVGIKREIKFLSSRNRDRSIVVDKIEPTKGALMVYLFHVDCFTLLTS